MQHLGGAHAQVADLWPSPQVLLQPQLMGPDCELRQSRAAASLILCLQSTQQLLPAAQQGATAAASVAGVQADQYCVSQVERRLGRWLAAAVV